MTATQGSGTDPHPEVAEISDLTEGLLSSERAAGVREHIAGCSLCADVLRSLTEIRGLLGTLPGPQQIPADVAGRIDAALAAEALLDATRPGLPPADPSPPDPLLPDPSPPDPSLPGAPRSEPPRSSPSVPGQRVPRGTSTSTTHVSRGTPPMARLQPRDRPRRGGLVLAASVAALALLGGAFYEAASHGGSSASNDASSSAKKADGAPAGDPVAAQVRQLLAAPVAGGGVTAKGGDSPMFKGHDNTGPGGPQGISGVPSCVLKGTRRTQPPLAAGRDLFQGTESYLVVLPHPGDSSRVDAYVVSGSCTPSRPGALLFQNTYPR